MATWNSCTYAFAKVCNLVSSSFFFFLNSCVCVLCHLEEKSVISSLLLDTVKFDVFVCLVNMIFFLLLLLSPEGLISSIALESQFASLFSLPPPPTDGFMCQEGHL